MKFAFIARIDESRCVGCTRCLAACPVDAIIGAANLMHTVIAAECIGCRLCLEPCPVDCISMVPTPGVLQPNSPEERRQRVELARRRHRARRHRLSRDAAERRARLEGKKAAWQRGRK